MNIENEIRILEINLEEFINKIESIGAKKQGEFLQRRYVYDFNPKEPNKWIRLRTNGNKTTYTIKKVNNASSISGTEELEIQVNDFDKANEFLNELGYKHRNYQENYRRIYILNDTEISIDSWPMIPTYVEIEGKTHEDVLNVLKLINPNKDKVTTLDVESIYKKIYGIDILKIKELEFEG